MVYIYPWFNVFWTGFNNWMANKIIIFAIVPHYGNEYMTKENKNWTSFKNFAPKLNLNHNIYTSCTYYGQEILISITNKMSWKHVCRSETKWPTKAILDWNKINMEELSILEFLLKAVIPLGLAGHKMIVTYSTLCTSLVVYHFISSTPL